METHEYQDAQEAYDLMNRWTQIKTAYAAQFAGKDVTSVTVHSLNGQPRFANVNWKSETHVGSDTIDLAQKILLDEPEEPILDLK